MTAPTFDYGAITKGLMGVLVADIADTHTTGALGTLTVKPSDCRMWGDTAKLARPYITLWRHTGPQYRVAVGTAVAQDGIQFDVWASSQTDCDAILNRVVALAIGAHFAVSSGDTVWEVGLQPDGDFITDWPPTPDISTKLVYRATARFMQTASRSIPV
jgi:hypothetical protein